MLNKNNVNSEIDLYYPMKKWLYIYLMNKYKNYDIITVDSHNERLDKALFKLNIYKEEAIGVDIKIDILGIAKKKEDVKLFFIEAKKNSLTLRDLGQLYIYSKLINPEEAFLMSSHNLGSLNKLLNVLNREDLLDYGNNKIIKKIKVAIWDINSNSPNFFSMVPKF
ncbi:hypothetical protein R4K52_05170 [Brachyspira pilosicoli]|uniref:hypothetical protein n=1 Tax=Brachyspira pilosicoli TaxID=52584 RepID=UPI0030063664